MTNVSLAQLTMDKMTHTVMPKRQCLSVVQDVIDNAEEGSVTAVHQSWGVKIVITETGHEIFVGLYKGTQAFVRYKRSLLNVKEGA